MLIPVGSTTQDGRSKALNAERIINMYAESGGPDSRSQLVLRSCPGLGTFTTLGAGPIRGMHDMAGVLFIVTGNDLYSVDSAGAGTLRGSAGTITGTGAVQMGSNLNGELVICNSSGTGWVWDGSSLASISGIDSDFGDDAGSVTFMDQYLVFSRLSSGQVFASDLNNAKSYNALSFGTAEAADDNAIQVYAFQGNIWVFGTKTAEVWYNAGTSPFPFARIPGAVLQVGGVLNSVADIDDTLYWTSPDNIIYQSVGLQRRRISTEPIENRIASWTGHRAFAYKQEGHAFYVLSANEGCVCYDAGTQLWHERQTYGLSRWRGTTYVNIYGKHLVGDVILGRVHEMSLGTYTENGNILQRRIITPPLHNDGRRVSMSEAQIVFDHGKGLTTGQGSDPQVILDWSDDGGYSYGNQRWASVGKIGEYRKRAIWRRLGSFRERNYRITYTDPTEFSIFGARVGH